MAAFYVYSSLHHRIVWGIVSLLNRVYSIDIKYYRGTKRLVSVNICSVEDNSAGIFVSKVSPRNFVIKEKRMPIIFGRIKLPLWAP